MTNRRLRHSLVWVKVAALLPFVLIFCWMAGTLLRDGARWLLAGDLTRGALAFVAGLAVSALAILVAVELGVAGMRWQQEQYLEDKRCCPDCDGPIRPGVIEKGRLICLKCARAGWATASELPVGERRTSERRAGA